MDDLNAGVSSLLLPGMNPICPVHSPSLYWLSCRGFYVGCTFVQKNMYVIWTVWQDCRPLMSHTRIFVIQLLYINSCSDRAHLLMFKWCLDSVVWCETCRSTCVARVLLQKHALLNRVESVTCEEERIELRKTSNKQHLAATLLPIRSVGVQVTS